MGCSVLLVDDDETIRTSLELYLEEQDCQVHMAGSAEEGLQKLSACLPEVMLVDLKMPGKGGFYLIEEARKRHNPLAIIVISGHADVEKAVRATKMGACHFLEKPFSTADVMDAIRQAVGPTSCAANLRRADRDGIYVETDDWSLIGASRAMRDIYGKIRMVARAASSTALVQGESGTGKELVARAIYEFSDHASDGQFVDVNCAALSESLLEAELFGHEKGSFTGATESRPGLFGAANGGAIFLDEIGEMPLKLQAKLLRVLEEKTFKRVGGTRNIEVDCRVIASTNRDLWEMVQQDEFRRDLFYRLDVFTIRIPPLRERPEDIPVLSAHFLRKLSESCNKHFTGFTEEALDRLRGYHWPGNVRELRNVIERAVILGSGSTVGTEELIISHDSRRPADSPAMPLGLESIESMERRLIRKVLEANDWQRTRSAEILGINRTTLWQKIKRYDLNPPD